MPSFWEVCSACLRRSFAPFDPRRCSQQTTTPELLGPQVARPPLPSPPSLTAMSACKVGLQIRSFHWNGKELRALALSWSASHSEQPHWRALIGANMDLTTLLIIVVVVLLLGG